jgi:hypothetical protein
MIALNKSAVEAVNNEYQAGRDLRVVELYFSAPSIFAGKVIFGPAGFKIASSLIREGFYTQALPIMETAMNSTSLSQTEEAFYLYAKTGKRREKDGTFSKEVSELNLSFRYHRKHGKSSLQKQEI